MEITKLNINFTVLMKAVMDSHLKIAAMTPAYNPASNTNEALRSEETSVQKPKPVSYKAFFEVDENKNVVIKVVDSEGRVIRQVPPEEYLKMAAAWKENIKNLFHKEA